MENIPIKLENGLVKELKSCTKCYKFIFKNSLKIMHQSPIEEKMNSLFRVNKQASKSVNQSIKLFNYKISFRKLIV